jgi:hypothetical protein
MTGTNRIMIYGPKEDDTYVVEFRTAEGEVLAGDLDSENRGARRSALPGAHALTGCTCGMFRLRCDRGRSNALPAGIGARPSAEPRPLRSRHRRCAQRQRHAPVRRPAHQAVRSPSAGNNRFVVHVRHPPIAEVAL